MGTRPERAALSGAESGRLTALDGLRGLAALVVVLHHALLTWQVLADQYVAPNSDSGTWWLTFTPLHLAWAGTEAVMVFFVLSGFVLTLPFLGAAGSAPGWAGYYGRRLVRLYVPVAASLAGAALLVMGFPRVAGSTTSWWFNAHAVTVDAPTLASDVVLLNGLSWIHPSLWSLQYEVLFSLLLPLYVLAARRFGSLWPWLAAGLLVLVGLGAYTNWAVLSWLPVFGIGVCMAAGRIPLLLLGRRLADGRRATAVWWALAGAAVVLLLAEWWLRLLSPPTAMTMALVRPLAVAGAALVVFLVMACPAAGALCRWRPVAWLGTVSFSLYLVHEPILVSVSSLVGGSMRGVAVTLVVGIALSFLAAAAFHRWVEAPSQRLARTVGRRISGRSRPAVPAAPVIHRVAARHGARTHAAYPPPPPAVVPAQRVVDEWDDRPRAGRQPARDLAVPRV